MYIALDRGENPVSMVHTPDKIGANLYELYDEYSPVQDVEVRDELKRLKF